MVKQFLFLSNLFKPSLVPIHKFWALSSNMVLIQLLLMVKGLLLLCWNRVNVLVNRLYLFKPFDNVPIQSIPVLSSSRHWMKLPDMEFVSPGSGRYATVIYPSKRMRSFAVPIHRKPRLSWNMHLTQSAKCSPSYCSKIFDWCCGRHSWDSKRSVKITEANLAMGIYPD